MTIHSVNWDRLYQSLNIEPPINKPYFTDEDHADRLRHILAKRPTLNKYPAPQLKFKSEKMKVFLDKINAVTIQLRLAGKWYHFMTF